MATSLSRENDRANDRAESGEVTVPGWFAALKASWRRSRSVRGRRYAQLATVSPFQEPEVRTVVIREFLSEPGQHGVILTTDLRSQKMASLQSQSRAELCWWFSKTREQYRLRGEIKLVCDSGENGALSSLAWQNAAADKVRQRLWESMPEASRETFFSESPGLPLTEVESGESDAEAGKPDLEKAPENFVILVLVVDRVDLLDLRPSPHQRQQWQQDDSGDWEPLNVVP